MSKSVNRKLSELWNSNEIGSSPLRQVDEISVDLIRLDGPISIQYGCHVSHA